MHRANARNAETYQETLLVHFGLFVSLHLLVCLYPNTIARRKGRSRYPRAHLITCTSMRSGEEVFTANRLSKGRCASLSILCKHEHIKNDVHQELPAENGNVNTQATLPSYWSFVCTPWPTISGRYSAFRKCISVSVTRVANSPVDEKTLPM